MPFKVPDLPYAYDALEPVIDKQTMELHHDKHHAAYVTKLNGALENNADWSGKSIDEICRDITKVPENIRGAVRNNGGGHWNHAKFWGWMAPKGKNGQPSSDLARKIDSDLGGLQKMKESFNNAAVGRFGSGWAWIIVNEQGKLEITSTPNQDNPLMKGVAEKVGTPILGCDVWEHAYYLKYQNKRPDYVAAWWDVVNWNAVNEDFAKAKQ